MYPPVSLCLTARTQMRSDAETETLIPITGAVFDVAHSLSADGFDASEDGTGRGTPLVPVAYQTSGNCGAWETGDITGALDTGTDPNSHVVCIQERAVSENVDAGPQGSGIRTDGAAYTLEARHHVQAVAYGLSTQQEPKWAEDISPSLALPSKSGGGQVTAVAFAENSRAELRLCGGDGAVSSQLTTGGGKPGQGQPCVAETWAVRRLTPIECERLMGFPDDFTLVPWRKGLSADGPRYKAIGNSMAVNVMRWIGQRIQLVDDFASLL